MFFMRKERTKRNAASTIVPTLLASVLALGGLAFFDWLIFPTNVLALRTAAN